jgi:sulfopyruvate decarboxylase subunit beta
MNRQEVIQAVLDLIPEDAIVVSNIADASFELCMLKDRPRNFYMLGSFGLAPSIGLGLALSRPEKIVVINGDGALLYNFGCLPTEGRYAPKNYLHLVVDNGAHGATGHQPTATSTGVDLAAAAVGCGLRSKTVTSLPELKKALSAWLADGGPAVLVAKAPEHPPKQAPLPAYSGRQIAERFRKAIGS